jgi:SAM-dependent methyltransferase
LKTGLLSLLSCPTCHSPFQVNPIRCEDSEIMEGALVCSGCGATYSIKRGIPRFLPLDLSQEKKATAAAFGYEWTHYSALTEADKAEFLDWISPLRPQDFAGRIVLDAGCGKGRHMFQAIQFHASEVVGIDLSDAVEAAFQNTRHLPNAHVVQADISNLPFADPFDLAYSIGVLHHLPDPKQGFLALAKHVKQGGRFSVWVYGKEGNLWVERFVDPIRIHLTSKAPKAATQCLSFLPALPLYLALKTVYGPVHRNPRLAWMKQRLPYSEYLCAISGYTFAENFWNVFDQLVAPTAFYHRREELQDWYDVAKFEDVEISRRNNNSWRGTGLTPMRLGKLEVR